MPYPTADNNYNTEIANYVTQAFVHPRPKAGKHPFEYQAPTETQVKTISRLREATKALYQTILENVEPSRYRSLAITELELMSCLLNKAIVFEDEEK